MKARLNKPQVTERRLIVNYSIIPVGCDAAFTHRDRKVDIEFEEFLDEYDPLEDALTKLSRFTNLQALFECDLTNFKCGDVSIVFAVSYVCVQNDHADPTVQLTVTDAITTPVLSIKKAFRSICDGVFRNLKTLVID